MDAFLGPLKSMETGEATEEELLKTVNQLSAEFDNLITNHYQAFLEAALPAFERVLTNTEPVFISESPVHQIRKGIFEMIHRLPISESLRPHVRTILNFIFSQVQKDNEDNVVLCLRIIIEFHKQFRPPFVSEVTEFLQFVKSVYKDLPVQMEKVFEPRPPLKVASLADLKLDEILEDTFTVVPVILESKGVGEGSSTSSTQSTILPKARRSLKVLQELPIIVVLMYQIYKASVQTEVADFIPVVMATITLQPSDEQKNNPNFNKEVLVEFMGAQVKTLSFLAYIIKLYQDLVVQHSNLLVTGLIQLLVLCPMEVAYLRRELFIATRHIMATDLRFKFVIHMEKLFDEDILLGKGWTVNETMRPLAYSTLADLVHHVRQHLSLADLNRAVLFFSCHVHDESLPLSIQTMSCKLLFNLVDSIRLKSEAADEGKGTGIGREILTRMLDVLVHKFKVVSEVHIPYFTDKYSKEAAAGICGKRSSTDMESSDEMPSQETATGLFANKEDGKRLGPLVATMQNYSFTECRGLVKTVVCAVKTISWGIASSKPANADQNAAANTPTYKQFNCKETEVYLRLMKWGLKAIDIYAVNGPTVNVNGTVASQRPINAQGVRSKEEKEVLEHFAGAFTLLNVYTFREIFSVSIELLVQRIHENNAIQVIANNLLANSTTSAVFATILVEFLLKKMPEMGEDAEKSNLYLRLFKLVFGSVSLFPAENEQMLRPHLRDIVNKSMELALNAKDPFNYFLLLRALFRSIGGGSHDLLYQEFLPLLPSLLQGLNSLQSGLHKQHMKDLFVELCLTVPVRLSSLLPYLPMLMDPLVSALNGSPTLISQGLRTLELCVDNLQPDFLYEHIQPVRADLMQALWRTLRVCSDHTSVTAFRILGKFGGSNRKMLVEPQKLEYLEGVDTGQYVVIAFQDHKSHVNLPLENAMQVAVNTLKSQTSSSSMDMYYKRQAWEFLKVFVLFSLEFEPDHALNNKVMLHPKISEQDFLSERPIQRAACEANRRILNLAISGWFIATTIKELRKEVYTLLVPLLRHIAMIMTVQQAGEFANKACNMDPYVVFDSMAEVLGNEDKDLKRPVLFGLSVVFNCIINIVRSKDMACSVPMMEYVLEKFTSLCYERAWYTKLGGCQAINFFIDNMSTRWILSRHDTIMRAMFFILTDLTNEVSAGTLDLAKEVLMKLFRICATCVDENLAHQKQTCMLEITRTLAKQVTSPISNVRLQSMQGLELLAELQGKTVSAVMEPHKDVLNEMVLPKKHVIRHQSYQSQIGILEGNWFCLSLQPKLITLDPNTSESKAFVNELIALTDAEESSLTKLPCYKGVVSLTPVRIASLKVLACVAFMAPQKDKVFNIFLKALSSGPTELQKCSFECLKKFLEEFPVDMETQVAATRPALQSLHNMRTVTMPSLTQLAYLYQLFPQAISDKVWEQLLQIFRKCLEMAILAHQKSPSKSGVHELKSAVAVLNLFQYVNNIPLIIRIMEHLGKLCLQGEKALMLGKGCPLRQSLMKVLLKTPSQFIDLAFSAPYIQSAEWNRFFIYFLQHSEAGKLRECLMQKPDKLIYFLNIKKNPVLTPNQPPTSVTAPPTITIGNQEQAEIQYFAIKVMTILSEFDPDWILGNGTNRGDIILALRSLWESDEYQSTCNSAHAILRAASSANNPIPAPTTPVVSEGALVPVGATPTTPTPAPTPTAGPTLSPQVQAIMGSLSKLQIQTWKEPQMISKLLLSYYTHNPQDYDMLFKLLLAFCGRTISQYHFLKDYIDKNVTKFSVAWKRQAFEKFVDAYNDPSYSRELLSKIMQYVLVPCLSYSLEKGQADELLGVNLKPDTEGDTTIPTVFIMQICDPDKTDIPDSIRIFLYQLLSLITELAPFHIHDSRNKSNVGQPKLRRAITFAWPCLLNNSCVDSSSKYYGHLLLCHIIAKFNIHKRIVLQLFHSLLKASLMESKPVVKQALDIITPALPSRMDDGYTMLIHWTKKILLEEGHSLSQLMHIFSLVVRHWKIYYPVRHPLVQPMINGITRLGFTATSTYEHRKLAVEVAEVIIKWELERIKNEGDDGKHDDKRVKLMSPHGKNEADTGISKPIEKMHTDGVVNFLLRMACQVNEPNPNVGSQGEALSKRCIHLIKTVLKPDVWRSNDLKLSWFDKLFGTLDSPQVNFPNICTALDILTFLIGILDRPPMLEHMKSVQKGVIACMTSTNGKVIRGMHLLLTKLTSLYPTEFPGAAVSANIQKCEELEPLYTAVSKVIFEGLNTYDKMSNANPQTLYGPLMLCKAACASSSGYIDRIIIPFMKCLQKLSREHLSPAVNDGLVATELLTLSLDLVKNRVGVMGVEMRKAFIGTVLVSLIEKSTDTKVMQTIIKMLDEWVKNKSPQIVNQAPSIREKSILLVKLMQNVEKRFPNDQDLIGLFLELINFIYRDENLKNTELNAKLEPAFLSGLRCTQPLIREKFFHVFDNSIRRKLHERLLYIVCSQNWEAMGPHYWIKQCEELLLAASADTALEIQPKDCQVPPGTFGYSVLDPQDKDKFVSSEPDIGPALREIEKTLLQEVERDLEKLQSVDENDETLLNEIISKLEDGFMKEGLIEPAHPDKNMKSILSKQRDFIAIARRGYSTSSLLKPLIQLCHYDTTLAEKTWIDFFPRMWKIFSEKQQVALANEMVPFLCSGVHVIQQNCQPSAIGTFVESMCQCKPAVPIPPTVLFYLGKTHNLWHRMGLLLEQLGLECNFTPQLKTKKDSPADCYEFEPSTSPSTAPSTNNAQQQLEILDSLSDLYSALKEEDLWAGLWQRKAKYQETNIGIAFELQGYYEKAQGCFELAMGKSKGEVPSGNSTFEEYKLWEEHWLKCVKELNQWDIVLEYGNCKAGNVPAGVLEASWRQANWSNVKDSLSYVEVNIPRDQAWKVNLYRGYIAICSSEDQNLGVVERYVETCQNLCIREWKRLPPLVSSVHIPFLQAAQQIVELHEATLVHQALLHGRQNTMHETKSVVKTWRNRLPCISDELSHWSDIFTWRQLHYQFISHHFVDGNNDSGNQTMLGVHASAQVQIHNFSVHQYCQAICHFGKIARKQNQTSVCLEALSKIYTIPSVPIVDCFQKIKQQVKCYIQQAQILGRNELSEALEIVESTNLKYFSKEMTSEFFSLKGSLLAQIGRSDDANKAFSAACQMHDAQAKSWGLWGDYLENLFTREPRNMQLGISAVTAFMHACRHNQESKARKYIAKILWLLMYDDDKGTLADTVDKYCMGVPPIQWLPWVPQLLTSLVRHGIDGKMFLNVLNQVGRMYPQAVYFPIRTLYLTLKVEQREKVRSAELIAQAKATAAASGLVMPPAAARSPGHPVDPSAQGTDTNTGQSTPQPSTSAAATTPSPVPQSEAQAIKATPSMWRCSKLMHMQRDLHPTILASLEGIVDQIIWFRENWYEEVLRQLKLGLAKCYAIAFENRTDVHDTTITKQLQNFVSKLVSTFGHGSPMGVPPSQAPATPVGTSGTPTIEALLTRRTTNHDPSFNQMKIQFSVDFESSAPGSLKLQYLITKLRKWIKILEQKCKQFPKSCLMDDKYRFLLNFNSQIADIELPGECLIPKHAIYYIKIARFQPRVEIVQKHNFCGRRICIRGSNGKVYPYLIAHDSCLTDARKEERVVQMIRMLNHYLGRQKVTAKRNLKFTVPKVVPVSPQMRLVEDNPASLSLLDVFKTLCNQKKMEYDAAISRYYEKLGAIQSRGGQVTHQVMREILRDIQANLVPRTMLREWAVTTFPSPCDYWMFRKIFTLQLCLSAFAEYAFQLTRLNPEIMYLHKDSGMVNISYFKFDIDEATGELESNRPVPFRLTPNIAEFISSFGVNGPVVSGMISLARCLVYPNYKLPALMRAILRDEMISWMKKKQDDREMLISLRRSGEPVVNEADTEAVISMVTKSVNATVKRLQALSSFDGTESKVSTLVVAANNPDNLCRMDPTWHPWL